jgi:hypothetical protein
MRAQREALKPPTELYLMVTVCDGAQRYPSRVKIPIDASWAQVMTAWHAQGSSDNPDLSEYPGVAAMYVFKSESGDPATSMDGVSR